MDVYIWIVTLYVIFCSSQAEVCRRDTKCRISRIHSMKAADCYDKDLTQISQCLPKDVEIVDLSHNRIRKLAKDDLARYSNLKILYLNDNLIAVIEKEIFEGKDYLQTLDLSLNAITKLPPVLFHLPSLQSLYLGQNANMNIADVVEKTKPVTSPLFQLDINNVIGEDAIELPNFGLFPSLEKYNISGNKLMAVNTKHFAGLCSLKVLDTTNVTLEYEDDPCDCWKVNRWLKNRKISFKPFICTKIETDCPPDVPLDDLKLYDECIEAVKEAIKKSKMKTILLVTLPIVSTVILLILIYCYIARRKKSHEKSETVEALMLNNVSEMKK